MVWKRIVALVVVGVGLSLQTGCATKAVWQTRSFNEPALEPRLELFHAATTPDVLVVYDEWPERGEVRRRAYHLSSSYRRNRPVRKPRFVDPELARDLTPIPIVDSNPGTRPGVCATVQRNGRTFTLYKDGIDGGSFSLPVYPDRLILFGQVMLTPLAVVADTVVIGGTLGLIFLAESGYSGTL